MSKNELVFQGENADEEIMFVLHRHPWTLMRTGEYIVVLLLILTAIFIKFQGSAVTSWAFFVFLPIILYMAFQGWFLWNNSVYVLTNERIIAVDQRGWFNRTVKELSLDSIMSISHDVNGASATFMNYGDVNIQAAGATEKDLVLNAVFDPYEVQQQIVRARRDHPTRIGDKILNGEDETHES